LANVSQLVTILRKKMQKIKTALLSYGLSGKVFHAPFLNLHPGFELVGSWERSKKCIQEDYPGLQSFSSLESILEDSTIDLVVVNTPIATHFEYAKKVLNAGKHLIVEKAFTSTLAEAKELAALAIAKNLKLSVFQNRRWDSDFKTLRKVWEDQLVGELVEAEFHFDRFNPQLSPKVHKETVNSGSGIVKDLGPHLIDQGLCLFGIPNAVFADIRITREQSVIDDYFDILLYYPNFRLRLKAGYFVREPNASYVMHGKLGSFLKSRADVQEDELRLGKKPNLIHWGNEKDGQEGLLHTQKDGTIIKERVPTLSGNYYDFFQGVYESIIFDTKEPVTAQDGIHVMQIIEAAFESNQQRKIVAL
jgi:scyllo-inositol 2-dehydrogenase (NADP+)